MNTLENRLDRAATRYACLRAASRYGWVVLVTCVTTACGLPAAFPVVTPPSKVEVIEGKRGLPSSDRGWETRVSTGVHLGSALAPDVAVGDPGMGYVLTRVDRGGRLIHGVYGEVGSMPLRLGPEGGFRLDFSVRGEAMFHDSGPPGTGFGLFGRVGLELVGAADPPPGRFHGVARGTGGLGVVMEYGDQKLPGGDRASVGSLGLWLRLPAAAGAFW